MIIKVCGMRDPDNIRSLENLEIDYMGFIFYAKSPRYVMGDDGQINAIHQSKKKKAGVFVNEEATKIIDIARIYQLDTIQLHGNESPEICFALHEKGYGVIKAFQIAFANDFKQTEKYLDCVDYFLFDTKYIGYGGSGKRFDWSLLQEYKESISFILSGGLTSDCLSDIKNLNHPQFAGVDLNSGFEISPGVKDFEKIKTFIKQLNNRKI